LTYLVEDVVSGRMTPTRPDPCDVKLDSFDIAEKLTSKDFTVSEEAPLDEGDDVVVDAELLLLLQAAVRLANEATASTAPQRLILPLRRIVMLWPPHSPVPTAPIELPLGTGSL
jgi:hypothetical protein